MNAVRQQQKPGSHPLSQEQRQDLWAKKDGAGGRGGREHCRHPRLAYHRADVTVQVTQPGGGTNNVSVAANDLSTTGISFLYPGFLYAGSKISIVLKPRNGGEVTVNGRVVWCSHFGGAWHGVGVRFAEPIFPKTFVDPGEWEHAPTIDAVKPEDLKGNILLVDDQELEHALTAHLLRQTPLKLVSVFDADAAVTAVGETAFNVVCVDLHLGYEKPTGIETIQKIRVAGYTGPIIALSVDVNAAVADLKQVDVSLTLTKPIDGRQLMSMLGTALNVKSGEDLAPLYSQLAGQDGIDVLLEKFCTQVQGSLKDLRVLIEKAELARIRHFCQGLRGTGTGFGFPALSMAATDAVKALDAGSTVEEASGELSRLELLCRRLTPKKAA